MNKRSFMKLTATVAAASVVPTVYFDKKDRELEAQIAIHDAILRFPDGHVYVLTHRDETGREYYIKPGTDNKIVYIRDGIWLERMPVMVSGDPVPVAEYLQLPEYNSCV